MIIKFKRLTDTAKLPEKNHDTDAGMDFFADEVVDLMAGKTLAISTGVAWEPYFEDGITEQNFSNFFLVYMKIQGRSGLALNNSIEVLGGTIDSDYRGEIKIILNNASRSNKTFSIRKGDKIAQGIVYLIPKYQIEETKILTKTKRNEKGFGSSDEKKEDLKVE